MRFLQLTDLTDSAIARFSRYGAIRMRKPSPVFGVMNAELAGPPSIVKEKLAEASHTAGRCRTVFASSWNLARRVDEFQMGRRYNFAVCIEEENRGYGKWRLAVKDASPVE